ncbi:hypothetical protein EVAR_47596_1 [Eumeta japonica]|uniref:Uncharacterized protein n=1 Tax=Eumeta variegata TaxID=151549 RepID=A0A4C1WNT5_EUMVA|nr:hypothetical protein EVAR_47596_1 [Eumeta japonica]
MRGGYQNFNIFVRVCMDRRFHPASSAICEHTAARRVTVRPAGVPCAACTFLRLPWLSRVTGNQGSIPEREPEKRLPHPRKAAGAQITHSRHGELHLCAALSVHRTRGATDTPAEHIVGEPFRGRSRIGTRRFNLQNPIALLLNE